MKSFNIGVDVGGTNIKFGLVNSSGKIVARQHLSTKEYVQSKKLLIDAIVSKIETLLNENKVNLSSVGGIGFGLPGLINPEKGIVNFLPNIPGWKNVPLAKIIQDKIQLPVFLDNDVNLIALAEWRFGAGKGFKNLICFTLGTGVGGGLIFNDHLYRGEGFVAGEIGHMPLNEKGPECNCGGFGCFERYVGNKQLISRASHIFHDSSITLPDVFKMANTGNRRAVQFWEDVGLQIGNALVGVVNLLNPRLIVIGGGVANNLSLMKPTIEKVIKQRAMSVQSKMVKIVRAKLGDDAGIIGAHVLVQEELRDQ